MPRVGRRGKITWKIPLGRVCAKSYQQKIDSEAPPLLCFLPLSANQESRKNDSNHPKAKYRKQNMVDGWNGISKRFPPTPPCPEKGDPSYVPAFTTMKAVSPSKPVALYECGGYPNPDSLVAYNHPWLYALPWWVLHAGYDSTYVVRCAQSAAYTTLDEIPDLRLTTRAGLSSSRMRHFHRALSREKDGIAINPQSSGRWTLRVFSCSGKIGMTSSGIGEGHVPTATMPVGLNIVHLVESDSRTSVIRYRKP